MLSSSAITARYSLPQRTKRWTCKRQAQGSIYSISVDIEIFHESRTTAIRNLLCKRHTFDELKVMISYDNCQV